MRATFVSVIVFAIASVEAIAQDVPPGKRIFDRFCAECHAPGAGHPGTQQLGWTRGEKLAVLEERKGGVPADYVRFVVRNGLMEMPAFRPTEIDEAALKQLAEYLARPPSRKKR
jgi:mono/diheme cytochrome c family protein